MHVSLTREGGLLGRDRMKYKSSSVIQEVASSSELVLIRSSSWKKRVESRPTIGYSNRLRFLASLCSFCGATRLDLHVHCLTPRTVVKCGEPTTLALEAQASQFVSRHTSIPFNKIYVGDKATTTKLIGISDTFKGP
jgi:hypothetical protein